MTEMASNSVIRRASKEDLPAIYRIEVDVFGEDAWHPIALGFFLYLDLARFIVYDNGEIVGYAIGVLEKENYGHILNIAVRDNHRRKGVGSLLLSQLEAELEKLGAKTFYLEVRVDNYDAISFYRKNGYNIEGLRKKYYRDGMDALIMAKKISA